MTEYYTKGVVLELFPRGESDASAALYTKDLGKIIAKIAGARNIDSKLSGHLQVGRLTDVRIVMKNSFKLADALSENNRINAPTVRFLDFINRMTPYEERDPQLWNAVARVVGDELLLNDDEAVERKIYRRLLQIMGFGPKFAKCHECDKKEISHFSPSMLGFLCSDAHNKLRLNEKAETVKI